MKNRNIILTLFGEGAPVGAAAEAGSAPESGGTAEVAETPAEPVGAENDEIHFGDGRGDDNSRLRSLESAEARNALLERIRRRNAGELYNKLLSEASSLGQEIEGFELESELSDSRFCAMLACGLSVREAWRAVHCEELIAEASKQSESEGARRAYEALRDSAMRPEENGIGGQSPISRKTSAESLSGRGIRDILARVEKGARVKF